jgi:hypothetical protein
MNPRIVPKGLGYLATPYTKYEPSPSAAYTAAAKLAGLLMRCGHTVFSPIVHGHPIAEIGKIDPLDYKLWRTLNRLIVPGCDYLIIGQLAGWAKSTGLAEEIIWFEQMRKPIYHCDPQSLVLTPRALGTQRGVALFAANHPRGRSGQLFPRAVGRAGVGSRQDALRACRRERVNEWSSDGLKLRCRSV